MNPETLSRMSRDNTRAVIWFLQDIASLAAVIGLGLMIAFYTGAL